MPALGLNRMLKHGRLFKGAGEDITAHLAHLWDPTTGWYTDAAHTTPATVNGDWIRSWYEPRQDLYASCPDGGFPSKLATSVAALNGKNCLEIRNTGDSWLQAVLSVAQPFWVAIVFKLSATAGYPFLFDGTVLNNCCFLAEGTEDDWAVGVHSNYLVGGSPDTNPHQASVLYSNGTRSLYIDGSLVMTDSSAPTDALSGLTIGARYAKDFQGVGYIPELRIYSNETPSTAKRQAVEAYQKNLYGTP